MQPSYEQALSKHSLVESAFDMLPFINPAEVVLHIPHAATFIPNRSHYLVSNEVLEQEVNLLTDWHTQTLFQLPGLTAVVAPFSRVFCDVERLVNELEPMAAVGRGFYYTHRDNGEVLREQNPAFASYVWEKYYQLHHEALSQAVAAKIEAHGRCLVLDCHSFPAQPLRTDADQSTPRPDVGLGVDGWHTPPWLLRAVQTSFEQAGFSVGINTPYVGTLVPLDSYEQDHRVLSIMIELNRDLYLAPDLSLDSLAYKRIQGVLAQLLHA